MKDEGSLERAILEYLSRNEESTDSFHSFTTIFEEVAEPYTRQTTYFKDGGEINRKEYIRAFLDQMVADGLLDSQLGERGYEANYRLTDQGQYEASGFDQLTLSSNVLTDGSGEPLFTERGDFLEAEEIPKDEPITVDSSKWTGLTKTIIDARNAKVVSGLIGKALDCLPESEKGNFEIMQATAYLKAARELVDAPEPPSEEIWRFISRAADIVGLVSFFYLIFEQVLINAQTH